MNRALFLDRDGVINVDKGYVHKIEDFQFKPEIFETCRRAKADRYMLIVITNQSGIARGYFTLEQYNTLTDWMKERFEDEACPLDGVYMCPDVHPSSMRKPAPGMILQAAIDHGIDLHRSILMGDKKTDIAAGRSAGVGTCVYRRK